jgi:hypothetical protein
MSKTRQKRPQLKGWDDPAKGFATYRKLRGAFITAWLGAIPALAISLLALDLIPAHPWLRPSVHEGVVMAGCFVLALPLLVGLVWWTMGRPLARAMREKGMDPAAPVSAPDKTRHAPKRTDGMIVLLFLAMGFGAALAKEYTWQDAMMRYRADPFLSPGKAVPSGAGLFGTVFLMAAAFRLRGWLVARQLDRPHA